MFTRRSYWLSMSWEWVTCPANTTGWTNAGLMLAHRLRCWVNISPALRHCACYVTCLSFAACLLQRQLFVTGKKTDILVEYLILYGIVSIQNIVHKVLSIKTFRTRHMSYLIHGRIHVTNPCKYYTPTFQRHECLPQIGNYIFFLGGGGVFRRLLT